MASTIDCVYNNAHKIKYRPAMIIQHTFMMKILSNLYINIPELKEYMNWWRGREKNWLHFCNKKESRMSGNKEVIEELFYTKEEVNR